MSPLGQGHHSHDGLTYLYGHVKTPVPTPLPQQQPSGFLSTPPTEKFQLVYSEHQQAIDCLSPKNCQTRNQNSGFLSTPPTENFKLVYSEHQQAIDSLSTGTAKPGEQWFSFDSTNRKILACIERVPASYRQFIHRNCQTRNLDKEFCKTGGRHTYV